MRHTFSFRMDEQTRRRLDKLSQEAQRSRGNLLRRLIFSEYMRKGHSTLAEDGYPSPSEMDDLRAKWEKVTTEAQG